MKKILFLFGVMVMLMLSVSCSHFKNSTLPKLKKIPADGLALAIEKYGECEALAEIKIDTYAFFKIESEQGVLVKALNPMGPIGAQEEGIISELCKGAASIAIPAFFDKMRVTDRSKRWKCKLQNFEEKSGAIGKFLCGEIQL